MTDPLRVHTFRLGGQTRKFKFNHTAMRILSKRYGGIPVREALRNITEMDALCEFGSAGMTGAGDGKATPERIGEWLDKEPLVMPQLAAVLARAVMETYKRQAAPGSDEEQDLEKKLLALDKAAEEMKPPTSPTPSIDDEPASGTAGPTSDD
jgi:hypothetical protein